MRLLRGAAVAVLLLAMPLAAQIVVEGGGGTGGSSASITCTVPLVCTPSPITGAGVLSLSSTTGTGAVVLADSPTFTTSATSPVVLSPVYRAGAHPSSDVAPTSASLRAGSAWSQATVNTAGATTNIAGGIGRRFYTVLLNTGFSAKTLTVTVNGTAVTLTAGTTFALGSDDTAPQLAVTATNIANAINADGTLGPLVTATAVTSGVYIDPKPPAYIITLATNAGGTICTATQGNDGTTAIRGNTVTVTVGSGSNAFTALTMGTTQALWNVQQNLQGTPILGLGRQVIAKTGAYTTVNTDNFGIITNTGAGGAVTITLYNDPNAGYTFTFCATVAQDLIVQPSAGETLNDGATGYSSIKVNGLGNCFTVAAVTGGSGAKWVVTSKNGTVTDTP